jgi:hypothetical protein
VNRLHLLLLSAGLLVLVGCGDDYGEPCSLPQSATIDAYCGTTEGEEGDSTATCVFTNSAQCSSRMCATYIGSSDFCTIECDPDNESSCPGDSFCQGIPAASIGFCVPISIQNEVD